MNEVEILLELMLKIVKKKYDKNPNGGIKISPTCKMKYNKMIEAIEALRVYVLDWGSVRCYGICKDCEMYHPNSKRYGKCGDIRHNKHAPANVNCYNTCWHNTSTRWDEEHNTFNYPEYPSEEGEEE